MDSYHNKNEDEMLNASLNQSNMDNRYPLANYPNKSLQNTNYKDWLTMCEGTPVVFASEAQAFKVLGATIARVLGLIPAVGPLLSSLVSIFWPTLQTPNTIWQDMMKYVADLIRQELTTYTINQATRNLTGLYESLNIYNRALAAWKINKNHFASAELVRGYINDLHIRFGADIQADFTLKGYETILLPSYASAANLHLLLLRDISVYGKELGYSQQDLDFYYGEQKHYTERYSNHCVNKYNAGLNLEKQKGWSSFNRYRRDMTLLVLDLVALFPLYDLRIYPSKDDNINVKSELTREIYSDVINAHVYLVLNEDMAYFAQAEALYTRQPHLFTWLRGFRFVTNSISSWTFLSGSQNKYSYTNNNSIFNGPFYGQDTEYGGTSSNMDIAEGSYIYQLWTKNYEYIYPWLDPVNITKINFSVTDNNFSKEVTYGGERINIPTVRTDFDFLIKKDGTGLATHNNYSHILSSILTNGSTAGQKKHGYSFAFTHSSVDQKNSLSFDKITQIPAVKSSDWLFYGNLLKGPGHTGGDLVFLDNGNNFNVRVNFPVQSYRVRIRYAADGNGEMAISVDGTLYTPFNVERTFSNNNYNDLKFEDFKVIDTPLIYNASYEGAKSIFLYNNSNKRVIIDKIEFIPIGKSALEYESKQNLEQAQKAVNDLFTNDTKNMLKTDTTDYQIDQVVNWVDCVSEELYVKEKMILRDEIKYAKQQSLSRNLLQNGDFEDTSKGWTTSNTITIQADNPIFKGHYLNMSGAREIDGTIFPTYIYQKIDESKLKPYTRYQVRGFVGSSKGLEFVVTRYGKETDAIMNVPNDWPYIQPNSSCGDYHRCDTSSEPVMYQGYPTPLPEGYAPDLGLLCQNSLGKKHVVCHDRHQFDFHITTGELDINTNLGIQVLFKISSPDGYATLNNLEVIEEGPLSGESLERVKHREKKWKQNMEAKRLETQQAYNAAKQVVDSLFTNAKDESLRFDTTLTHIMNAEHWVQSIPYVDNAWSSDIPGTSNDLYVELEARLAQARYLYDAQNVITNGNFTQGLMGWHATRDVEVQQMNGASVLVLSNWSAGASQNVHAQHHQGYVLRVIARKEGTGKGYVTMMDCNNNQETLTFTSCEEGYITKTVEVFPDTDSVRIEIGETEGSFYIESIELNCMKGYYDQKSDSIYDQGYNNNYNQNSSNMHNQGYKNNYNQNGSSAKFLKR
ncbi:insecticidal delta-endotoxin Cry8Ea1 family protein [Bacillus mycoides]|uniref:Crystaline entomocidal protoxin n=2 Tax=Bacillus cereus group TaxID=86661 RepID=I6QMA0_BACTU|nr:insecticidal delta-endotoxin Cry8Ea1 family protein [Bacillus mycoides]AFM37572.1 crystal protein [Bacillus thuringiensis serovar vazensis]